MSYNWNRRRTSADSLAGSLQVTIESIVDLEAKLSAASENKAGPTLWAVVLLEGGILHSLYITGDPEIGRRRLVDLCCELGLPEDDPGDEEREVYFEELAPQNAEFVCERRVIENQDWAFER